MSPNAGSYEFESTSLVRIADNSSSVLPEVRYDPASCNLTMAYNCVCLLHERRKLTECRHIGNRTGTRACDRIAAGLDCRGPRPQPMSKKRIAVGNFLQRSKEATDEDSIRGNPDRDEGHGKWPL